MIFIGLDFCPGTLHRDVTFVFRPKDYRMEFRKGHKSSLKVTRSLSTDLPNSSTVVSFFAKSQRLQQKNNNRSDNSVIVISGS